MWIFLASFLGGFSAFLLGYYYGRSVAPPMETDIGCEVNYASLSAFFAQADRAKLSLCKLAIAAPKGNVIVINFINTRNYLERVWRR